MAFSTAFPVFAKEVSNNSISLEIDNKQEIDIKYIEPPLLSVSYNEDTDELP